MIERRLAAIVALSVALNLGAALALGNGVVPLPGTHDQVSYDSLAWRVASGHGLTFGEDHWPATRAGAPTAHWSFLYTGWLAGVYGVFGHQPLIARMLQAVAVGTLLPLSLFRLGRLAFDERAGLVAAAICAVYAYYIYYAASLMTEMATIVAVVWALVAVYEAAERPTVGPWLAIGLLTGIVALLRQVAVVPLGLAVAWLVARRHSRHDRRALAAAAALALALVLPVTARNWRAFGRFVPINTNAGYAFYWANHPIHGTSFQSILDPEGPGYVELIPEELLALDEAALNDALMTLGIDFVVRDPTRYVRLSLSRIADYFLFWPLAESSTASNLSRVLSFGLLLPFALHGLWISKPRWRRCLPLYLFAGTYTLLHLMSWSLVRYRLPVDAVLMLFAASSVCAVATRIREQRPARGLA